MSKMIQFFVVIVFQTTEIWVVEKAHVKQTNALFFPSKLARKISKIYPHNNII